MAGTVLNYTSGASINGMGRDYVGVTQPSPVDSDLMIVTDTLTNQTNGFKRVQTGSNGFKRVKTGLNGFKRV